MKLKSNSISEKFINFLIIFTPFIDLFNGMFKYVLNIDISPGIIIRSLILVIIIYFYIKQKRENIIKLIFVISLFLIQMLCLSFSNNIKIFSELSFVSKIYYNIFLIYLIDDIFNNNSIDYEMYIDRLIKVCLIVSISLIITKALGIGISSYGDAGGYKGLYMGTNDLTAVLIMTFPFIIYRLATANNKLKYIIYSIISGLNIVMIGTKTSILVLIIVTIFYIYNVIFKEKKLSNIILVIICVAAFSFIFKEYLWSEYSSTILVRQKYFLERQDIMTYFLSERNVTLINAMKHWGQSIFSILLGVGFTNGSSFIGSFSSGHGLIEMDFFDILYFYGIGLFLIVGLPLIKRFFRAIYILLKSKNLLLKTISLIYMLSLIISFLGGHVILSPLAGIYFAIIYGMLKKEKI